MSIGSISPSTVSAATQDRVAAEHTKAGKADAPSIADHVAAQDNHEPIRSVSTTLGTLVDTYL